MQRAFAERVFGDGERLRIRIGLHAGAVIPDEDDFFGRNVVLAARIADRARGGEILVSSELKEYTEIDPSFAFEQLGELELKGLLGSHVVYSVAWAG
jgi:class 3 adenylate cyclase